MDAVRGYLQLASGLTQVTLQKATEVARQLLAATPAGDVGTAASTGAQALSGQVSALADELMSTARQNRDQLRELVRAEVETVVARLGLAGTAELEAALAASQARVLELERELGRRDAADAARPRKKSGAKRSGAKRSGTTKATAKKSTAKTTAAKKSTAKASAAKSASTKSAPRQTAATTASTPEQTSSQDTSAGAS